MTGVFELFIDEETLFRFRLKSPDGTVVAVSRPYPDKSAAVSGISDVREYAGMGLITDQCPDIPVLGSSAASPAAGADHLAPAGPPRRRSVPPPRDRTGRQRQAGFLLDAACTESPEAEPPDFVFAGAGPGHRIAVGWSG